MTINKERLQEAIVTAAITFIVGTMGTAIFDINAGIYSGIAAGLSMCVGKEYGDSLNKEHRWEWGDILFGGIGVIIGVLLFCLFVSL